MSLHQPGCGCKSESELGTNSKCLYQNINVPCVTAINEQIPGSAQTVFKKYNERFAEGSVKCMEDDEIEECKLLINVPMHSSTSLSHIIVISQGNSIKLDIYKSNTQLSFEDLDDLAPAQSLKVIPDLHGSILNPLKVAKLSNLSHITLVFSVPNNEQFEINYIGLRGTSQMNSIKAVETVYEARPNIADHISQKDTFKFNLQM